MKIENKYFCKDCKKEISVVSAIYGGHGRCSSCSHKGKLSGMYNKHHTLETKLKISNKKKNYIPSKATIEKIKKANKGKIRSQISKKRYSESKIGEKNPNYHKKMSKETIRKMSESRKGKNNPMYGKKGKLSPSFIHGRGYEPYTSEFTNQLKNNIRTRDNYTCQKCGTKQKNNYKVRLAIHHIDYNKKNCNENNLITLCQKCNNQVNKNRSYWEQYFKKIIKQKINYWSCSNCNCIEKIKFKNNVIFAFGLTKKPYHKEDYYRFCISKGNNRSVNDIMREEVYSMLMGLSSILFRKRITDINRRKNVKNQI